MRPERILLPLDVRECPLEMFSVVEGCARRPGVTVILLHVIHLNIVALESRVYEELALEARWYLERLAKRYLPPSTSTLFHVRIGKPVEQILGEAKSEEVQLILLPTYGPSFWRRAASVLKPGSCRMVSPSVERIIRDASCGVFVTNVKTRFDCEKEWGPAPRETSQEVASSWSGFAVASFGERDGQNAALCDPTGSV